MNKLYYNPCNDLYLNQMGVTNMNNNVNIRKVSNGYVVSTLKWCNGCNVNEESVFNNLEELYKFLSTVLK